MKLYCLGNISNKMTSGKLFEFEDGRYERKFAILNFTIHQVELLIKLNPKMFSEIFYKRKVNNIYLHSFERSDYEDNVVGNPERSKTRIRWYGKLFELTKNPVLEIKIKRGNVGRKISFPLKSFKLDKKF